MARNDKDMGSFGSDVLLPALNSDDPETVSGIQGLIDSKFASANAAAGAAAGGVAGELFPGEVRGKEEDEVPFIGGFPPSYVPPNQSPNPGWMPDVIGPGGNIAPGRPLYTEGAELDILGNMSIPQIRRIQTMLESLGIVQEGSYTPDLVDQATIQGFGNLLALANANGLTWQAMGSALQARGGIGGSGGGPTRAPLVTRTSNPETLKRYLRRAVVEMTGSAQSPDIDIDQMVEAYQSIERSYQEQIYNAQETGGNVVEPPSFDEYAQGQIEEQFGTEVQTNSIAERAGSILQAIAGGRI